MARGKNAKVGDTRVAANGYHYTKTETAWRLTHHIVAEKALRRPLEQGERVTFIDNDRTNLKASNIKVTKMGGGSLERREAQLEARIEELQAELHDVREQIKASKLAKTS